MRKEKGKERERKKCGIGKGEEREEGRRVNKEIRHKRGERGEIKRGERGREEK